MSTEKGPYTGTWENGYYVCRDTRLPDGNKIFLMSPTSEAGWIDRLNAAYAAGAATRWSPRQRRRSSSLAMRLQ